MSLGVGLGRQLYGSAHPETATIYTRGTGGGFTVVANAGLPCRIKTVDYRAAAANPNRQELAGERLMFWAHDYAMPDPVEVEVQGARWTVRRQSVTSIKSPLSAEVVEQRATLVYARAA